jgi:stress-induced morphogen
MRPEDLEERLLAAYPGSQVQVIDLTGTSDHFEVHVASSAFGTMSRVDQHKGVMDVFKQELATGELHALSIKTKSI